MNEEQRKQRIVNIKRGTVNDNLLKQWLNEDPDLALKLVTEGVKEQKQIDLLLKKSPEEHRANYSAGKYNIEDIKRIKRNKELPDDECQKMIKETYVKDVKTNTISIDDIRINRDLSYDEKASIISDFHLKNIVSKRYSDEKIEALLGNNEITEQDIKGVLPEEELKRFLPCFIEIDALKWKDLPPVEPNRTDIFVLGTPRSGKSTLMSGLLHYASHNEHLTFDIKNHFGAKYLNQLVDAVYKGCVSKPTPEEYMQFMSCDFIDNQNNTHPLTFMEMSGEVFAQIYTNEKAELPEMLNTYITGSNHKILVLVIDYEAESGGEYSARSELIYSLKILEKHGALAKVDAINIVVTKWDLCKDCNKEDIAVFLENRGYGALRRECEGLAEKYKLSFTFSNFSLGKFYGFQNKKYKYDETDSKRLFEWFCKKSAIKGSNGQKIAKPARKNDKPQSGWKNLFVK